MVDGDAFSVVAVVLVALLSVAFSSVVVLLSLSPQLVKLKIMAVHNSRGRSLRCFMILFLIFENGGG